MFKVGDKVKYIGDIYLFDSYDNGPFGYVEKVGRSGPKYPLEVNFSGDVLPCSADELELVTEEKPKQYICDTEWSWYIADSIDDIPKDAVRVWELGDELVKKVTWEKKDA